jgi:hypothetical protein
VLTDDFARDFVKDDPIRDAILALCLDAEERGIDALTPPQRNVVLAWAALGIIGRGGFRDYYERDWRMREVAGAFRTLGFAAAAAACERSTAIFPGNVPPRNDDRRRAALRAAIEAGALPDADDVSDVSFDFLQVAIGHYIARFSRDFPAGTVDSAVLH